MKHPIAFQHDQAARGIFLQIDKVASERTSHAVRAVCAHESTPHNRFAQRGDGDSENRGFRIYQVLADKSLLISLPGEMLSNAVTCYIDHGFEGRLQVRRGLHDVLVYGLLPGNANQVGGDGGVPRELRGHPFNRPGGCSDAKAIGVFRVRAFMQPRGAQGLNVNQWLLHR